MKGKLESEVVIMGRVSIVKKKKKTYSEKIKQTTKIKKIHRNKEISRRQEGVEEKGESKGRVSEISKLGIV